MVDIIVLEAMLVIGKSSSLLEGTENNWKIVRKIIGKYLVVTNILLHFATLKQEKRYV